MDGFLAFVGRHTGYTAVVRPKGRAFQTAVANCEVVQSLVRLLYAGATAWLDRKKAVADDILGRSWPARKRRRPAYTPGGGAG